MAFDTITPARLGQASIGVTNTLIYTVPASTRTFIKDIDIANTSTAFISVTLYIGTGTATANTLLPAVSIPPNSVFQWTGTQIINATETIYAIANATGTVITVSGGEGV